MLQSLVFVAKVASLLESEQRWITEELSRMGTRYQTFVNAVAEVEKNVHILMSKKGENSSKDIMADNDTNAWAYLWIF